LACTASNGLPGGLLDILSMGLYIYIRRTKYAAEMHVEIRQNTRFQQKQMKMVTVT
jgi:hypothetical protein